MLIACRGCVETQTITQKSKGSLQTVKPPADLSVCLKLSAVVLFVLKLVNMVMISIICISELDFFASCN